MRLVGNALEPGEPGGVEVDAIGGNGAAAEEWISEPRQFGRWEEEPREEIRMRKRVRHEPGVGGLANGIGRAAVSEKCADQRRADSTEGSRNKPGKGVQARELGGVGKALIAGEQLVAT